MRQERAIEEDFRGDTKRLKDKCYILHGLGVISRVHIAISTKDVMGKSWIHNLVSCVPKSETIRTTHPRYFTSSFDRVLTYAK